MHHQGERLVDSLLAKTHMEGLLRTKSTILERVLRILVGAHIEYQNNFSHDASIIHYIEKMILEVLLNWGDLESN